MIIERNQLILKIKQNKMQLVDGQQREPLCSFKKLLLASKQPNNSQRHLILKTKCTIKKKVHDMIMDNVSSDNIVSKSLVKALKLSTIKHPSPYKVSWIKKRTEAVVSKLCIILLNIKKYVTPCLHWQVYNFLRTLFPIQTLHSV